MAQPTPGRLEAIDQYRGFAILLMVLADLYHGNAPAVRDPEPARRVYPWVSLAVLGAGLALALVVPVSKHRASASFVLFGLGLSALVFFSLAFTCRMRAPRSICPSWAPGVATLYRCNCCMASSLGCSPCPRSPPGMSKRRGGWSLSRPLRY